ncbi:MAG: tRNA pseudouridine(55) synthase TruB [Alphaproteobacteria bacterium]|nr:tRNA pseudouridine(55) synthase TruB [Alphaproteobacteria bacterium]
MNAPRTRVQRRPVHGVLLLDKPLGLSSNQALQKAKWLLRADKAGHTGTLDPLASGVLPLCFGAATKFSQSHLDADKAYETTVALGVRTATGDAEGEVIETRAVSCTLGQVVQVLDEFTGDIDQVPPMHSALKKDGKALYEYARQGQTIERAARRVRIHDLDLLSAQFDGDQPHLDLRVRCSKGTYIRALGEDIAQRLGCGGHLTQLRRIATGPFELSASISLDAFTDLDESARMAALLPVEVLFNDTPEITLDEADAGRFLSGLRRRGPWPDQGLVRVYGAQPRALLGSGHVRAGELIPTRLLSPLEIEQVLKQRAA